MSYTSAFQGNYIDSQVGKDIATQSDINNIWKTIYPVGAVYISFAATSPQTLFGGTWERLNEVYLYASDDVRMEKYGVGDTFGAATHTHTADGTALTVSQIPSHKHGVGYYASAGNYLPKDTVAFRSFRYQSDVYSPYINGGMTDMTATGYTQDNFIQNTGDGAAHTHTIQSTTVYPPSIRVYMWRRTA